MSKLKIFFEITDFCNHKCIHCCKYWRQDCFHTMSYENIDKIFEIPASFYKISGGEPGCVRDKVLYAISKANNISMNTNLTLWKDEDFQLFKNRYIKLYVSVVSTKRNEYIEITDANTFDIFLDNLTKIDTNSIITLVINPINIESFEYNINFLAEMGFTNFTVTPMIPTNNLQVDEIKAFNLIKTITKYKQQLNIKTMYYNEYGIPYSHTCEAGIKRIVILSNGDIVPCACFNAVPLGNIKDKNFNIETILAKGKTFFNSFPINQRKECKGHIII